MWATAPYLHNGSVPSLYALLLPSRVANTSTQLGAGTGEHRPEAFGIGNRLFDPTDVGFDQNTASAPFVFTVRDENGAPIPGNFNSGHDYGNVDLTEEERLDLVEYLKSL